MTVKKLREEIAWWLAVLAAGLLCLILLPFYPLCWLIERFSGRRED